jgi:hypothetical protein
VYLETSLLIGLVSQDLDLEQEPLRRILEAGKAGRLSLVTSAVTREEILKGTDPAVDEAIYLLLADVPLLDEEALVPRPVSAGAQLYPPAVVLTDKDLETLVRILPHRPDASHVFQAMKNGVHYFVTNDKRSILSHTTEIEKLFPILLRSPSELVRELGL